MRVVYVGSVGPAERSRLLGKAWALLHPIRFDEPFGLSVIESMACGTPVIAFDRGSMPELIDDGDRVLSRCDIERLLMEHRCCPEVTIVEMPVQLRIAIAVHGFEHRAQRQVAEALQLVSLGAAPSQARRTCERELNHVLQRITIHARVQPRKGLMKSALKMKRSLMRCVR